MNNEPSDPLSVDLGFERYWYAELVGDDFRNGKENTITGGFERLWKGMEAEAIEEYELALVEDPSLDSGFNGRMELRRSIWHSIEFRFENYIDKLSLEARANLRESFGYKSVRGILTRRLEHIGRGIELEKKHEGTNTGPGRVAEMEIPVRGDGASSLVEKVKAIMAAKNWNYSEVSERIGRHRSTLNNFLRGKKVGEQTEAIIRTFIESNPIRHN